MDMEIHRLTSAQIRDHLDDSMRRLIGELIFEALPEFYGKLPLDKQTLFFSLSRQVDVPSTELEETYALWSEHQILGILSVIDAANLKRAQKTGTIMLAREISPDDGAAFRNSLVGYANTVEELESDSGKYLPRLAVKASARGRGVARSLMKFILELYPHARFSLHVACGNTAVMRLHKSLGFSPQSTSDLPIQVWTRSAQTPPI